MWNLQRAQERHQESQEADEEQEQRVTQLGGTGPDWRDDIKLMAL